MVGIPVNPSILEKPRINAGECAVNPGRGARGDNVGLFGPAAATDSP